MQSALGSFSPTTIRVGSLAQTWSYLNPDSAFSTCAGIVTALKNAKSLYNPCHLIAIDINWYTDTSIVTPSTFCSVCLTFPWVELDPCLIALPLPLVKTQRTLATVTNLCSVISTWQLKCGSSSAFSSSSDIHCQSSSAFHFPKEQDRYMQNYIRPKIIFEDVLICIFPIYLKHVVFITQDIYIPII